MEFAFLFSDSHTYPFGQDPWIQDSAALPIANLPFNLMNHILIALRVTCILYDLRNTDKSRGVLDWPHKGFPGIPSHGHVATNPPSRDAVDGSIVIDEFEGHIRKRHKQKNDLSGSCVVLNYLVQLYRSEAGDLIKTNGDPELTALTPARPNRCDIIETGQYRVHLVAAAYYLA